MTCVARFRTREVQLVPHSRLNPHTATCPGHSAVRVLTSSGEDLGTSPEGEFADRRVCQGGHRPAARRSTAFATSHAYVAAQALSISRRRPLHLAGRCTGRAARRPAPPPPGTAARRGGPAQLVPPRRGGRRSPRTRRRTAAALRSGGAAPEDAVHVDRGVLGVERRLERVERGSSAGPPPAPERPAAGRSRPTCSPAAGPGGRSARPPTSRPAGAAPPARAGVPDGRLRRRLPGPRGSDRRGRRR